MLEKTVKNFSCYGEGWASKSIANTDLSKFSFGKGYTIYYQRYSFLDPLFGSNETLLHLGMQIMILLLIFL